MIPTVEQVRGDLIAKRDGARKTLGRWRETRRTADTYESRNRAANRVQFWRDRVRDLQLAIDEFDS